MGFRSMEDYFLPEEIITQILYRLPAESVLECRRVCKTWRTLTYLPSFARLHLLQHSPKNLHDYDDDDRNYNNSFSTSVASSNKVGFISLIKLKTITFRSKHPDQNKIGDDFSSQLYYGEFDDDGKQVSHNTLRMINYPTFHLYTSGLVCFFGLVSSCNGLICIHADTNGTHDPVYICNPITREYISLPKGTQKPSNNQGPLTCYGFGYVPKTNEYKVVKIYPVTCLSVEHIEVYTLGSGSGWRFIGETTGAICPHDGVFANGALHWSKIVIDGKRNIASFDLADEKFHLLPGPPCQLDDYKLLVLGGLLCAFCKNKGECAKIWSLKKQSSGSRHMRKEQEFQSWGWILEFCIEWEGMYSTNSIDDYTLFSLTENGELLFWRSRRLLYRYNPKTKSLKEVADYAHVSTLFYAIPHINSFISLQALGEDAKIIKSAEGVLKPLNN